MRSLLNAEYPILLRSWRRLSVSDPRKMVMYKCVVFLAGLIIAAGTVLINLDEMFTLVLRHNLLSWRKC